MGKKRFVSLPFPVRMYEREIVESYLIG